MRDNEVSMAIYRFGEALVVHAVAPSEQAWRNSRKDPKLEEWHTYMATLLQTDEKGNIAFEQLEPAFQFGMFAPVG